MTEFTIAPARELAEAARSVQLALTPVFLLSGVAALLNVFASRLGRVSDQTHALADQPGGDPERVSRLRALRRRSQALDTAVVLAALAGACTCGAILILFLGAVLGGAAAGSLFLLFGGAVVLTMGSITGFVVEMLMAARSVRKTVDQTVHDTDPEVVDGPDPGDSSSGSFE